MRLLKILGVEMPQTEVKGAAQPSLVSSSQIQNLSINKDLKKDTNDKALNSSNIAHVSKVDTQSLKMCKDKDPTNPSQD